jgi:heterodisulfide reductase subunit A
MSKQKATALIIGGGIAGLEAALQLGRGGYHVVLVDKAPAFGGHAAELYSSFPRWEDPKNLLKLKLDELITLPNVITMLNTEIIEIKRQSEEFIAHYLDKITQTKKLVPADVVILCTGFDLIDTSIYGEYGYGIYRNVVNSLEFEHMLHEYGQDKTKIPENIAFIKCVGSRDRSKGFPYCSKICCMYTAKQAGMVKKLSHKTKCYVFYMDYRACGKEYEEFVRSVIEDDGVRYVRGRPSKVIRENDKLLIRFEDTLIGIPMETSVELIVLAGAVVPRRETSLLTKALGIKTDDYGFIEPMYGSAAKIEERIYFAGACGFAVESLGAAAQGAAAAAEVMALFNKKE